MWATRSPPGRLALLPPEGENEITGAHTTPVRGSKHVEYQSHRHIDQIPMQREERGALTRCLSWKRAAGGGGGSRTNMYIFGLKTGGEHQIKRAMIPPPHPRPRGVGGAPENV